MPSSIQILSDLHLENPPAYDVFDVTPVAPHLALVGDIGDAEDDRLYAFLRRQLEQFQMVFFLLGNHEPYHSTWSAAFLRLRQFEKTIQDERCSTKGLGAFVLLDKTRYDLSPTITILGCTLYSNVPADQHAHVRLSKDFYQIKSWTVEAHTAAHAENLAWLNASVSAITKAEPERQVIILTHYSPTSDKRSIDPRHANSKNSSGFLTDLSGENCWNCPNVRAWAYGHTHFNCDFTDEKAKIRVLSNQRGYSSSPAGGFDPQKVLTVDDTQ
ncbi:Metallo-dependent phosphatase [Macrophomina phaseolina MS6]|uniref:Metallo-dependent phosphatase n=1 Tax=Macrophomina phaseolina (strain MS6) TaxID=1126212 RepID=K2S1Q5_MACPH|nr:Metallo-dependent phosphatase [Macrophomina phaseolina MS6]